jgi:hypothetical protein
MRHYGTAATEGMFLFCFTHVTLATQTISPHRITTVKFKTWNSQVFLIQAHNHNYKTYLTTGDGHKNKFCLKLLFQMWSLTDIMKRQM